MRFKILKSSLDGISGGSSLYETIDEVCREINYSRGWDSLDQLHGSIRKWAYRVEPGSVFQTQATAVVAVGVGSGIHADDECTECGHSGMNYGEIEGVASGHLEQEVSCPECGGRWKDVFVMADRRSLAKRKVEI